ncbi:type II secretion system protein GspM [Alicyclobacillus mali (ex Roth et al. 2021)]|uniref:type II secretion system protein GspM n=1 Tax=Alicyclobacillus mali (ex Roth et al. 2021) TaxID=1123961 RepID=UPI000836DCE4|nr:type II secretion system protein GspM [Alicyclobacillus mali (ex Roth et al. 2021)]
MKLSLSRSLSERDKSILLALGVVVVFLLVYLIGVRPALNQLSNLAQERSSLEQTLASLGQVHARQQQQEKQGKNVMTRLPIGAHEANALEVINGIAQSDKVTLVSVALGQSAGSTSGVTPVQSNTGGTAGVIQSGSLPSLQYTISATGSTAALESFFADLAKASRLMTVTMQSITGTADGVVANFTLNVYYRNA